MEGKKRRGWRKDARGMGEGKWRGGKREKG